MNGALDMLDGTMEFGDRFFREMHAAAMSGRLASGAALESPEALARLAYLYADAMLARPSREPEGGR